MTAHEAEATRWFLQAKDDLRFAEWVFREGSFFDKGCFICQQAGEKALKACLYASGKRHVFGHSLVELTVELKDISPDFLKIDEPSMRLDRFYIPTRYPNGLPGGVPFQAYTARDLDGAIEDLKIVFLVCTSYLKEKGIEAVL